MSQESSHHHGRPVRPPSEPAFNVPSVVVGTMLVLIAIHLIRAMLAPAQDAAVLAWFAFVPLRLDPQFFLTGTLPGGVGADFWTFVTYGLLHGSWVHLIVNIAWMLAFGAPVAWRFGTARFLLFSALCTAAGAVAHVLALGTQGAALIGASAAVSGQMAAALRFMYQPGAPLGVFRLGSRMGYQVPALPLVEALRDRRVLTMIVVWLGLNVLTGVLFSSDGAQIGWQAHLGGFLAGILLFAVFDPVRSPRRG